MVELLLTGARGYLGSQVADYLRQQGIAFDVLDGRLHDMAPASLRYRCVVHCAGKTNRSVNSNYMEDNAVGTERLLAGLDPKARVVFVSSRKVYPRMADATIDENCNTAPWDEYGASKLLAECRIRSSGRQFVIFRAGTMFGHGTQVGRFGDLALQMVLEGRTLSLATPDRPEDYLDVEMMADILVQATQDGPHWNHIFNISEPVRSLHGLVADLNGVCEEVLGVSVAVQHIPLPIPVFPWMNGLKLKTYFQRTQQLDDKNIYRRMLHTHPLNRNNAIAT